MSYSNESIVKEALEFEYTLTPVPEKLVVEWNEGASYFLDGLYDTDSLAWISLVQDTFGEEFPGSWWTVDDPGTLYSDNDEYDEEEESPFDMERMQEVADLCLARYREVFELLIAEGVPVTSDGDTE